VASKNASSRCPYLLAKIDDFGMKCCILKENAKNWISGRKYQVLGQIPRRLKHLLSAPTYPQW